MSSAARTLSAGIVGGSGYTGGELLRLLLGHPSLRPAAVTSRRLAGRPVHAAHPNLRGFTDLTFIEPDRLLETGDGSIGPLDVIFLCLPHGEGAQQIERWRARAGLVVDLSADFRLRSGEAYREWYGEEHPAPHLLPGAVYGLAELHRQELRSMFPSTDGGAERLAGAGVGARLISGVGCNATAINLALLPLARAGLIERAICDVKVGSSEAGAEPSAGSHHPERSRAVRSYAPAGHRHAGEVIQELMPIHRAAGANDFALDVSVTAIELVRGVLATAHVIPRRRLGMPDVWSLFREAYRDEPFVRIVRERSGLHRLPDPRHVAGTNLADVGFDLDPRTGRIVCISAIDNLMKGAAGAALHSANLALGLDERAGLVAPALYPA